MKPRIHDSVINMGDVKPPFPTRRGGRQYTLPRVSTMSLSPGLRTTVAEFEAAVRTHAVKNDYVAADGDYGSIDQSDRDELAAMEAKVDRTKQALVRKLLRMQNGSEMVDVEQLKKNFRRMARFVSNVKLLLERPAPMSTNLDNIRQLFNATPEVTADVERIIAKRRSW